jgi:alcohol dehydrogenase (cytochrome c)
MGTIRVVLTIAAAALVACQRPAVIVSPATSVQSFGTGDWPSYNRTLAGDRYSPLAEIERGNVTQLRLTCAYTLPEVTSLQTGPIVVGGTMYFTTDTITYAIDAASCAEKWRRVRHSPTPSQLAVNRGAAYMDGRLFRGTSDVHVLALDAADGHTIWERELDAKASGVTIPMAPIAVNGLVFVGNAGGDLVGRTGHVYALDARDGRVVWSFDTTPNTSRVLATWPNAPRVPISGGAFWTSFTYDATNDILYVPAGNPAPDFNLSLREGDNLYTNSVIALDARTGQMLAYNQLVKRDFHDWDVDSPPTLVRTAAGRSIVTSSNKDGLLSVLDRGRVLRDRTVAEDRLGEVMPTLYQVPTTTRTNVDVRLTSSGPTRFCPGFIGGTEWNGAAYHPGLNTLYAGAVDWCAKLTVENANTPIPPFGQAWYGVQTPQNEQFDPVDMASGWITAVNADAGTVRWKFHAPKPVLAAVTPTAGGLLFAADLNGTLYAFDADKGNVLWRTETGQSTGGGIITYVASGRQRLAVASGMKSPVWPGGAQQSRILVYSRQ